MKRLARTHGVSESDRHIVRETFLPSALRDTSAPCASGDKCVNAPPSRVEIRGEQCRACMRVQDEMRARLRARR